MSNWEEQTIKLIGAMLADPDLIDQVAHRENIRPAHMYGGIESDYAQLYALILNDVYKENMSVTPDTVSAVSGGRWSVDYLFDLLYQGAIPSQIGTTGRLCKEYAARHRKINILTDAINELKDVTKPRDEIATKVIRDLSITEDVQMRSTRYEDVIADIVESYGKKQRRTLKTPTGFTWLDSKQIMSGGLRSARLIGIGGEEKNRKTTLARNMVLGALREKAGLIPLPVVKINPVTGEPQIINHDDLKIPLRKTRQNVAVAFLAYENDREITTFDFTAMIMYEYMVYARTSSKPWPSGKGVMADYCDGETIQDAFSNEDFDWNGELDNEILGNMSEMVSGMPEAWQDALFYAILSLKGANLHTYDRDKRYGGLRGFVEMSQVANRFMYDYSDPNIHKIVVIDYAQLVKGNGSLFENMSQFAQDALDIATNNNATVITLSQFSRQGKRDQRTAPMDVMYTKGGADLEQAVHNYFQTVYSSENNPTLLSVIQRRSRRGGGGMNMRQTYDIHPASGLMLKESKEDFNPYK